MMTRHALKQSSVFQTLGVHLLADSCFHYLVQVYPWAVIQDPYTSTKKDF